MKIHFLQHHQIDFTRWDNNVQHAENSLPYAFSWYLNAVSPAWNALVSDDYAFVFPLTWKKKFGLTYLHQPYFTQQLGLFSRQPLTTDISDAFLEALPKHIRFVEINLNVANKPSPEKFNLTAKTNILLTLQEHYTTIYSGYTENVKRNISKAEKHHLQITGNIQLDDVIRLFKADKGREVTSMKHVHYTHLKLLAAALEKHHACLLSGVLKDERLVAGALFVKINKRIIFLFSGNSEAGKKCGAMHFLIDDAIKKNCREALLFDFEGSTNPGLARFYKSFGSVESVYLHLKKNTIPYPFRFFKT
jgi:hypothetical protein